jgi:hypothetical protein
VRRIRRPVPSYYFSELGDEPSSIVAIPTKGEQLLELVEHQHRFL